jgi:hypothetical protein
MLISEISPRTPGKFSLNPTNKKINQLKANQPLPLTANQEQKPTEKEFILLQKIQVLEKENNNLKQLVQQEKKRADNYQQQLKTIAKTLYQLQKTNYYKQLEKEMYSAEQRTEIEAKIIQPPPFKVKK